MKFSQLIEYKVIDLFIFVDLLDIQKKTNCITFQAVDPELCSIMIF